MKVRMIYGEIVSALFAGIAILLWFWSLYFLFKEPKRTVKRKPRQQSYALLLSTTAALVALSTLLFFATMDNLLLALGTTIQKGNVLHVLSFIPLLSYQLSPLLLVVLWRYVLSAILAGQMSTQYFLLLTSKEGAYADMFYEKRPPPKWIFISHAHAWIVALILSFIGILGVTLHPEVFYRAALGGIVLYGPYNTSIWSLIPSICLCGISFVYGVIIMALVIFKLSKSMDRGRYLGISVCIILSTITNAALSFTNINEDIGIYTSNAGELVFFFGLLLCERILVSTQEVQYNRSTNTN